MFCLSILGNDPSEMCESVISLVLLQPQFSVFNLDVSTVYPQVLYRRINIYYYTPVVFTHTFIYIFHLYLVLQQQFRLQPILE